MKELPEFPELVKDMLVPENYPDQPKPERIEFSQTQMSFLFFAGEYVYKVKKPVNLGYLDYTTLDKRRFFCEQEVKLNKRLCASTYLGVMPVTRDQGGIRVGGQGKIIEYAVKMRRLPQEAMMNLLLLKNQVSDEMVERVARKLADFHEKAESSAAISAFGSLDCIRTNTGENFSQTGQYVNRTVPRIKYERIENYTEKFIQENTDLFNERVAGGRIRDCHGDLHAAHICFTDDICIYDCIEFNDRFRYADVASEIAFLAMDLDHYGRADLSRAFVKSYVAASGDTGLLKLLQFYKCYRAYVRGKVEGFKLDDPYIGEEEKKQTQVTARGYFDLADAYARQKPLLLITVGLVGTGKSTVAEALARRLGLVVLSSDITRKQLSGVPVTEHRFEEFTSGIYSKETSRMTYDKMFNEARGILLEGGWVILDASFLHSEERLRAKEIAEETGADFFVIECRLAEELIKERLSRRLATPGAVSDGRWEILAPQKTVFVPVNEVPPSQHLTLDTCLPTEEYIKTVMDRIEETT